MDTTKSKVELAESALSHLSTLEEILMQEGDDLLGAQVQAGEVHRIVMALRALKSSWKEA
jgi:hypothetical protein